MGEESYRKLNTTLVTAAEVLLSKELEPSITTFTIHIHEEEPIVLSKQAMAGNQTTLKTFTAPAAAPGFIQAGFFFSLFYEFSQLLLIADGEINVYDATSLIVSLLPIWCC